MSEDVLERAGGWLAAGQRVAVATVIRTEGSAPRPVGSQLAVCEGGAMVGSVSAGCLEGAVVEQALRVIADGEPRFLSLTGDAALSCGGGVELYLEPFEPPIFKPEILDRLSRARAERCPVALVTDLITGLKTLVFQSAVHGGFGFEAPTLAEIRRLMAAGRDAILESGQEGRIFVQIFRPSLRLVIVGAVAIAQALVPMARLSDFAVTVIDPRRAFATPERFGVGCGDGGGSGVTLLDSWPDEALAALAPDARTAVVVLTHDPKLDDPALMAALAGPSVYVGALGSRATAAKRRARLAALGLSEADLARIHGPVGLAIGAVTPAEIAVSILAEVIAVVRRGSVNAA